MSIDMSKFLQLKRHIFNISQTQDWELARKMFGKQISQLDVVGAAASMCHLPLAEVIVEFASRRDPPPVL
jgi:hypothetical protein